MKKVIIVAALALVGFSTTSCRETKTETKEVVREVEVETEETADETEGILERTAKELSLIHI